MNKAATVMNKSAVIKGPVKTKSEERAIGIIKTTIVRIPVIAVIAVAKIKTKVKPGSGIVMISYRIPICTMMIKRTVKTTKCIRRITMSVVVLDISNS